jgi:WhiB family redox-sensing transcriptional regulator
MRYPQFDGSQACASIGTDLFYPEKPANVTTMEKQAIHDTCYSCRFQAECLEWGLRHEDEGIWGGLTPSQRKAMRRQIGIRLETVPVTVYVGLQNIRAAS